MKRGNSLKIIASIYGRLLDGETDGEIMDSMGLDVQEYHRYKENLYQLKTDELKERPPEYVYVDYVIQQTDNLQKLTNIIDDMMRVKEHTSVLIGAIRAKSDIHDKLIVKGQEFGLIKKVPSRKEIVAGVTVSELTNDDLKKAITGALNDLNRMTERYGDVDFKKLRASNDLYYGESLEDEEKKKKQKQYKVKPHKLNRGRTKKRKEKIEN